MRDDFLQFTNSRARARDLRPEFIIGNKREDWDGNAALGRRRKEIELSFNQRSDTRWELIARTLAFPENYAYREKQVIHTPTKPSEHVGASRESVSLSFARK